MFKIGDKVKVMRKHTEEEQKTLSCPPPMDSTIGQVGIVSEIDNKGRYGVEFEKLGPTWTYLPGTLEKVDKVSLTLEQVKEIVSKNPEFRSMFKDFTDAELGLLPKLRNWEECISKGGWYICSASSIIEKGNNLSKGQINYNIFATKKQALQSLAHSQLTVLMADLGEECDIDWTDETQKHSIVRWGEETAIVETVNKFEFLTFKTEAVAEAFHEKHKQLIDQFYGL